MLASADPRWITSVPQQLQDDEATQTAAQIEPVERQNHRDLVAGLDLTDARRTAVGHQQEPRGVKRRLPHSSRFPSLRRFGVATAHPAVEGPGLGPIDSAGDRGAFAMAHPDPAMNTPPCPNHPSTRSDHVITRTRWLTRRPGCHTDGSPVLHLRMTDPMVKRFLAAQP
jgi:hypothetical protein